MSQNNYPTNPEEKQPHIVDWLLAILQVVNASGRLAPQKAIQKRQQELVDTYDSDTLWEGVKQASMTFGIGDVPYAETLFRSHPNLPDLLQTEESAKKVNDWFEGKSAMVSQAHQLFCGLGKLVPSSTTTKFTEGGVTAKQRRILGEVHQILAGGTK
ncbi:unnamed protein product [marine sediment metagenome]|uniref:Uncharacterized protein n=1 Tax=marine sediment metagenome TaxID=412755 RepID=X1RWC8_9ZZZZ